MKEILVDNNTIECEPSSTLNQITHQITEQLDKEKIIIDIILDGETHPYHEDMPFVNEEISKFKSIAFKTVTSTDLAFQALDSCSTYIDNLSEKITELTKAYQASDFQKADILFSEVIDTLDLFIQLVSKIYSTLKRNRPSVISNTKGIQNLEIHLLSVLKALIPAKESNDYIMLCDLLEYELVDNLTQWKIKIIPNLKKLRNI